MDLARKIADFVRAAFTGLYIETYEPDEALREIQSLCVEENWKLAVWDIDCGLKISQQEAPITSATDPLAAVRSVGSLATPNGTVLLVLKNFHRFLNSAEIAQAIQNQLEIGKATRCFIVILAPNVQLPMELERQFIVLQHELPKREQLSAIARELLADESVNAVSSEQWESIVDAAAGLTHSEAQGAFALSLSRHDKLRAETVWEIKAQSLKKQNLLSLSRGGQTFAQLGGMSVVKDFCRRSLQADRSTKARGTLLLSPPGCGKSQFCRALGNEVGRPVLTLDIGKLMGSLVGETERNIRQALQVAEAMAPSILFVDEIEKGLSGINGTGDSGVANRLFGTLLTWLSDHDSDVYFIGTSNDIRRLPPEFTRAERFDAVFFVDLPTVDQRKAIWELYFEQFAIGANEAIPADDGWTGAEIKSCVRLSRLLDISLLEAAKNVVPVSIT